MIKKILRKVLGFKSKGKLNYRIGNVKHHNAFIDVLTSEFVEIGDNFISAPGAIILSHDSSLFNKKGIYRVEKTIIKDNVFLGTKAIILPGVTINDNAIVGAGAVVTKDVPENSVVAGNPARIICTVDEYYQKCVDKNCLYTPPKSFCDNWKTRKLNEIELNEFQNKIKKDFHERDLNE